MSCKLPALFFLTAPLIGSVAFAVSVQGAICDVRKSGAVGDGLRKDTAEIQATIDHCAPGGVVLLSGNGRFVSGTLRLKSDLTFRIEAGSKLLGSRDDADYPDLNTPTQNSQLKQCRKALLYGEGLHHVVIEGEGTIDGAGDNHPSWTGLEATRPMAVFVALSDHVTIQNLQVINSGMWSVVNLENTDVLIDHVKVDSHWGPTRDGIDIVDSTRVLVKNCEINSEDDSICLKSGSTKGLHDVVVRDVLVHNSLVANAVKIGTASVGEIERIRFENIKIENVQQAAMAVESVDGSRIHEVNFKNIEFANAGTAIFMLLGKRQGSRSVGSINNISFNDINGQTRFDWGSVISGTLIEGNVHPITGVHLANVQITNTVAAKPGLSLPPPPEYSGQYPDPRMWPAMPAYGIYLRHVRGFDSSNSQFKFAAGETRPERVESDVN